MNAYLRDDRKIWEVIHKLLTPENLIAFEKILNTSPINKIGERVRVRPFFGGYIFKGTTRVFIPVGVDKILKSKFYEAIFGEEFLNLKRGRELDDLKLPEDIVFELFPIWFACFLENWKDFCIVNRTLNLGIKETPARYLGFLKRTINYFLWNLLYTGELSYDSKNGDCFIFIAKNSRVLFYCSERETDKTFRVPPTIPTSDYQNSQYALAEVCH